MSSSTSNSNSNYTTLLHKNFNSMEEHQKKRQKIEKVKPCNDNKAKSPTKTSTTATKLSPPPDIIDVGEVKSLCSLLSSSNHSLSTTSSFKNSLHSTPSSSSTDSLTQFLNVQNLSKILPLTNRNHNTECYHIIDRSYSSSEQSVDEIDRSTLSDLLHINNSSITTSASTLISVSHHLDELSAAQDMCEIKHSLSKQCLCGVSERLIKKLFQANYPLDTSGQIRVANLNEWPTNILLQFLSNLQLLFNIYLKQNSKGFICARIKDVCKALVHNDHKLIDQIIVLAYCSNSYIQFLAGRVLASILVIHKQKENDDWLEKLVGNLFNFDTLDHKAVQKIYFSLEIIKRIVEWEDLDLHPLEEEIADSQTIQEAIPSTAMNSTTPVFSAQHESNLGYLHFHTQQPSLESNYFAVHPQSTEYLDSNSSALYTQDSGNLHHIFTSHQQLHHHTHHNPDLQQQVCHLVAVTNSESFDTTHLKCITIKKLENKWPALVKNMSSLIANHLSVENAENCILNFLQLWENIISVKVDLSIVETLPFYTQLDQFELLLNQNLSCTIYKQLLCLFNTALCYGSTLALQEMLPDEICMLARQIVRHVKDFRILESLPRRHSENIVGLIGFKRKPVTYSLHTLQHQYGVNKNHDENYLNTLSYKDVIEMDKTILQKIVLLVLKSTAVAIKEIRSGCSASSIDSTDYDQDMVLIERSIRDVLCKLESFIKHTLKFHPECHFSKILIYLFDDQDDHLIEAMVCTLDVTAGITFRNNAFPELVSILNPVFIFLEFLEMISNSSDLLLDFLISNETCFLLYLLRFLKYILMNWSMFVQSCHDFGKRSSTLDEAISVLIRLRLQISRLVSRQLYPYDISPVLRLLERCESIYEGNELS